MTIPGGSRHVIPRGTEVYNHTTGEHTIRRVSYPVHVNGVNLGRAYWFGDRAHLMSCDAKLIGQPLDTSPTCGNSLPGGKR